MAQLEGKVKVSINANQAVKQLEELDKKASDLRQELIQLYKQDVLDKGKIKLLEKELKAVEKEQRKIKNSTFSYQQVLNNLSGASINDLNKAYRQLRFETNKLERGTEEWKKKASDLNIIKTEISEVRTKMHTMNATTSQSQGFLRRLTNSFNEFGGIALSVIAGITAVVAGLGQIFQNIKKEIVEFEDGFTDILTLLSVAEIEEFGQKLEKGAIDTMKKFGLTSRDVNKALFDTVSAGINAANALDVLDAAGILATAGATNLKIATDGLTTVINAFGIEATEGENVASAFFSAQKYGKTTVEELATSVGKIAPVMKNAGVSYQETLSMMAELTKNGINTAEATTYLKSAFSSLIKPSIDAEKVLRKYGVPVGAVEIESAGLAKTLNALNNVVVNHKNEVASAIPNVEGMTAVLSLSGKNLMDFNEILTNVNSDIGGSSSLMQAFGIKTETAAFKMEKAKAEMKAVYLEMKENLYPIIQIVITSVTLFTNFMKNLTVEFFKNNENQKAWVLILKEIGHLLKDLVQVFVLPLIEAMKSLFLETKENNIIMWTIIKTLRMLRAIITELASSIGTLLSDIVKHRYSR